MSKDLCMLIQISSAYSVLNYYREMLGTALAAPNQVIVTTSTAKKYFGNENPVGKTLRITGDSSLYTGYRFNGRLPN